MSRWRVGTLAIIGSLVLPATAGHAEDPVRATSVYIKADPTTWRSKGRVSFPVVPSITNKLARAGLTVVSEAGDPAVLTLRIDYREEQGPEIRFNLYGTIINCRVRLDQPTGDTMLDLTIREVSPVDSFVTAPYTDVVHKLETNPYYYFLGEIVKERMTSDLDSTGALLAAFAQLTDRRDPIYGSMAGAPPNPGDTLPSAEELYVREVRANTMRELARLNDKRAVPVLLKLLDHPEWRVRRNAVNALAALDAADSRARIEQAAEQDPHQSVREAAKAALSRLQRS